MGLLSCDVTVTYLASRLLDVILFPEKSVEDAKASERRLQCVCVCKVLLPGETNMLFLIMSKTKLTPLLIVNENQCNLVVNVFK